MPPSRDENLLQIRIQSIYRASPAGMGIVVRRVFAEVNDKLCAMTGYTAGELVGRSSRMLYLDDGEFERVGTWGAREIRTSGIMTTETRWRCRDGSVIDVLLGSSPIQPGDPDSDVSFIALDITEHKRAENALRRSEERYRLLFGSISDVVLVHPFHEDNTPEVFIEVNDVACERLGYTRDELLTKSSYDIDAPEGLSAVPEAMRRLKAEGHAEWEGMHVTRDGRKIPVEISNRLFEMDGKPMILAAIRDISERKNAERASRDHGETLHALLNATTDMVFLVESDGTLQACNEAFAKTVGAGGAGELTGRRIWEMKGLPLDIRVHEYTERAVRDGTPVQVEITHESTIVDLGIFPIHDESGTVRRLAFFVRDVTATRKTEEQLRQAQKMEAVGRLAGGIAHDFNNLITVIKGFSDLVLGGVPKGSRLAEDIAQVKGAADRAAELTSRLLAFSRKQVLEPRVVDPAALIRGIETMLKRVIGEDIEVITELAGDTGRILADPGQIEQVLMNLVVNARDAMPRGEAPHLDRQPHRRKHRRAGVSRPEAGGVRAPPGERHRSWHGQKDIDAHFRAVLHDQGRRPRHRNGTEHGLWNRHAERGTGHVHERPGRGGDVHDLLSPASRGAGRSRSGGSGAGRTGGRRANPARGRRDGRSLLHPQGARGEGLHRDGSPGRRAGPRAHRAGAEEDPPPDCRRRDARHGRARAVIARLGPSAVHPHAVHLRLRTADAGVERGPASGSASPAKAIRQGRPAHDSSLDAGHLKIATAIRRTR